MPVSIIKDWILAYARMTTTVAPTVGTFRRTAADKPMEINIK